MPVKFKLGFTIDAKTLFGIMSKFLPIEDLSVEEVAPPLGQYPITQAIINTVERLPKHAPRLRRRRSGYAMKLHAGANAIIMAVLADGALHPGSDINPSMVKAGYATNGLYGRLERLRTHGYIARPRSGYWQITPEGKAAWEKPPAAAKENAA